MASPEETPRPPKREAHDDQNTIEPSSPAVKHLCSDKSSPIDLALVDDASEAILHELFKMVVGKDFSYKSAVPLIKTLFTLPRTE
jgi:hypothetical protein